MIGWCTWGVACLCAAAPADILTFQVPGSTLGPELAALLENSEDSDISFKVQLMHFAQTCYKLLLTSSSDQRLDVSKP